MLDGSACAPGWAYRAFSIDRATHCDPSVAEAGKRWLRAERYCIITHPGHVTGGALFRAAVTAAHTITDLASFQSPISATPARAIAARRNKHLMAYAYIPPKIRPDDYNDAFGDHRKTSLV
jgi:hypothetical protein